MIEPGEPCKVCHNRDLWGMTFCVIGLLTVIVLVVRFLWWVSQHLRWV